MKCNNCSRSRNERDLTMSPSLSHARSLTQFLWCPSVAGTFTARTAGSRPWVPRSCAPSATPSQPRQTCGESTSEAAPSPGTPKIRNVFHKCLVPTNVVPRPEST
ncbi:unnamed protein product, partial [Ixodes pacificus]